MNGLETERQSFEQQIHELNSSQQQLQITLETTIREKETLLHDHEVTLQSNQAQEMRTLELTNQIVALVREKETMEETVRQLQREVVSKDKERDEVKETLEILQGQSTIHKEWIKEKEVKKYLYTAVFANV